MSEDFKRKLQDYAEGKLTDEEREEVEHEMEKMEVYQAYLEEVITHSDQEFVREGDDAQTTRNRTPSLKEAVIIRRGKWKARVMNVFTVLSVLLVLTVISMIITGVFYGSGTPDRMKAYRDVVESAVAVSYPNLKVNMNGTGNAFFTMDFTGKLNKRVGDEEIAAADFSMRFLLNLASAPQITWQGNIIGGNSYFYHPNYKPANQSEQQEANRREGERSDHDEWEKLEKLPEGTVAEAYLSLDRLFSTDELLKQFEHKNMEPVWFAVDTGLDPKHDDSGGAITHPVGFPYLPIWQSDDLTVEFYSEEKTGWFGKMVSSGGSYPSLESYGDGEKRNGYFKKTLYTLQKNKSISTKVAPFLQLDRTIDYVEKNGVRLYGAVITGPVKELLKLREEPWVRDLRVGEVQLWNWQSRE